MTRYYDHLLAIRQRYGRLDPESVVEAATPPTHPLHEYFEWDNAVAGHKYRLEQAGNLLRVVTLPPDRGPTDLRGFVCVQKDKHRRGDYVPTDEALADDIARRLVLADFERAWRDLKARYGHLREFANHILNDLPEEGAAS